MDMKEKLVELILSVIPPCYSDVFATQIADHLIANGVTVQEGKPLEAFLHPVVAHKGLKAKYLVFGAASGKEIKNCFVLRPDKDPAAVEALRAYARTTDNETLAEDIYNWVGKGGPVQEWISVKDRLPEDDLPKGSKVKQIKVLTALKSDKGVWTIRSQMRYRDSWSREYRWIWKYSGSDVTHWMPLPQPPKGE